MKSNYLSDHESLQCANCKPNAIEAVHSNYSSWWHIMSEMGRL